MFKLDTSNTDIKITNKTLDPILGGIDIISDRSIELRRISISNVENFESDVVSIKCSSIVIVESEFIGNSGVNNYATVLIDISPDFIAESIIIKDCKFSNYHGTSSNLRIINANSQVTINGSSFSITDCEIASSKETCHYGLLYSVPANMNLVLSSFEGRGYNIPGFGAISTTSINEAE